MRFYYFLLVVTATLLASANASLGATTNSKLAIAPDFHDTETYATDNDGNTPKRFLRTKTTTTDKEERGQLTTNVLTKLQNLFKTGAASKVSKQAGTVVTMLTPQRKLTKEMLLKQQQYLDEAFTTKFKVNEVKGNIFKSPELQKWVTKRQKFNKTHHIEDESGFQINSKYFTDDQQLSNWIDIARRDPKLKGMVDQFRAGQLSQLFSVGTHPDKIYILLNVKKLSKLGQVSDNRALYWKYVSAYSKYWVGKTPPSPF